MDITHVGTAQKSASGEHVADAPEPSPEIRGDFLKWDTTKLAGVTRLKPAADLL